MSTDNERLFGYFIARHVLRRTPLSALTGQDRSRVPKSLRRRVTRTVFAVTAALVLVVCVVVGGFDSVAVLRASAAGGTAALIAGYVLERRSDQRVAKDAQRPTPPSSQ